MRKHQGAEQKEKSIKGRKRSPGSHCDQHLKEILSLTSVRLTATHYENYLSPPHEAETNRSVETQLHTVF